MLAQNLATKIIASLTQQKDIGLHVALEKAIEVYQRVGRLSM